MMLPDTTDPHDLSLPILYQDEHLVAVHKPSGLLVHRSPIDRQETRFALQTVRNQLGRHVYGVHRLDKGTSGILLFALSPEAGRTLSQGSVLIISFMYYPPRPGARCRRRLRPSRWTSAIWPWCAAGRTRKARLITRCRANPTSANPAR